MRLRTIVDNMTDRVPLQTNKAELPTEILPWRKLKFYKDTDMVYAYSKFDYVATTEQSEKTLEFLGLGYNATYHTDVLHKSHNLKLRNYDLKLKT